MDNGWWMIDDGTIDSQLLKSICHEQVPWLSWWVDEFARFVAGKVSVRSCPHGEEVPRRVEPMLPDHDDNLYNGSKAAPPQLSWYAKCVYWLRYAQLAIKYYSRTERYSWVVTTYSDTANSEFRRRWGEEKRLTVCRMDVSVPGLDAAWNPSAARRCGQKMGAD